MIIIQRINLFAGWGKKVLFTASVGTFEKPVVNLYWNSCSHCEMPKPTKRWKSGEDKVMKLRLFSPP